MSASAHAQTASPFRQPKAVFAVAFACVVSFMGIGLVDPVLPAISNQLHASPSQVTLLFTSYLVITAVAMLLVGWISSRIGAKRTLIVGLAVIVVFSALAGSASSINGIVGFRAGWGVGNALFIATSLAVIVASASGGFAGAIVLYETALGVGIACGPLLGGVLGEVSWRGPFYGVAVLMAVALLATIVLVEPMPLPARRTGLREPLAALRHRGLLTLSLTALCYNWGFFTLLGYAPFPMHLSAIQLGLVFTGWGVLVAVFAVAGAPWLQARLGLARTLYGNLALFAAVIAVIAIWTTHRAVLIPAVIVTGVFIGVNNTVTTQAVMSVAPVERSIASSAYGFVRFIGGGLAPYAAGKLVDAFNVHVPFYLAAGVVALGIAVLATAHDLLARAEAGQAVEVTAAAPPASLRLEEVEPVAGPARRTIVAAVDGSAVADLVTAAAGRLAGIHGATVDVVHVQEAAVTADAAADVDPVAAAHAGVRRHLDRLRAQGVPVAGHVLLHAADHAAVGRLLAEHARASAARTIVLGAPTRGGGLLDESASRELWRHAQSNIVLVNPAAADEAAPLVSVS
ncbi:MULTISPECIES: MFS transporter [Frankia]|uniref:Multidrug-efflux transporter protein n=2 Tax=Frankia TaxID=1854 RepID=Q0RJS6_FRAAA|nr:MULTISPECIES: MFS transporter [Frankia]CAJ62235.1 putative multidrug-efflux transporter protein [Frankia alni ACN14a]